MTTKGLTKEQGIEMARRMREVFLRELPAICKELGLRSMELGVIKYSPEGAVIPINATFAGARTKQERSYDMTREIMPNLPPLGAEMMCRGQPATVVGATTTGSKVIVQQTATGQLFEYPLKNFVAVYEEQRKAAAKA